MKICELERRKGEYMSMYDPTVYRYKILQNKEKINEKTRGRYYKINTFFKFFPSGMSSPGLFTQRALQQLARIKFPMSLQASLRQTRKLGSKRQDWQNNLERTLPDLHSPTRRSRATLSPSEWAQFGA